MRTMNGRAVMSRVTSATAFAAALVLSGCVTLGVGRNYQGPPERPAAVERYYDRGRSYTGFREEFVKPFKVYTVRRYLIDTDFGRMRIDYFHRKTPSKNLVFIFPALGGKNFIENYFADYLAREGFDAAIVHRQNDFKDPSKFDRLEEIMRKTLIRDRIAIDFFEREHKKTEFGTFGLSRGALNVAMTAGVDPRLKHNVLVLGGTDMVEVFKRSDQRKIQKYARTVAETKGITTDAFYQQLRKNLQTDPKYLAGFMNAKNTLLILSAFDTTVPFKYGMKLRKQIGYPRTIVLLADHYTSVLYTQMVKVFPPDRSLCVFPFDYIEGETADFFDRKFNKKAYWLRHLPLKILQAPANLVAGIWNRLFGKEKFEEQKLPEGWGEGPAPEVVTPPKGVQPVAGSGEGVGAAEVKPVGM